VSAFDPPIAAIRPLVDWALLEDTVPMGDVTSALLPQGAWGSALFVARGDGVIAGTRVVAEVFARVDPRLELTLELADGTGVERGSVIGSAAGPFASLLTAERTALNFLCHLSGVASLTARFVAAVRDAGDQHVQIRDTRKTTPGFRALEKAAVRAGGGVNHRGNLSDAVLVKDNHLGKVSVADSVARARQLWPGRTVEVEADRLELVVQAVEAGADLVLLDNMEPAEVRAAVDVVATRIPVEVSGGINLDTVARYANLGVDFISVGAITHSAPVLDIALDLRLEQEG